MNCYTIEDGAIYWVAANNKAEALFVWATHIEESGCLDDSLESVTVKETENIDRFTVKDEDHGNMTMKDALGQARALGVPSILACSEWP